MENNRFSLDFLVLLWYCIALKNVPVSGGDLVAGNEKSGAGIAFRLSEERLAKKIEQFRKEYGEGQHGMVSWEAFCSFLGYSLDQVRECYLRGKSGKNAYNGRAELLEVFYTECTALMFATCGKHQSLAKERSKVNHLLPEADTGSGSEMRSLFGCPGDNRWIEAMK